MTAKIIRSEFALNFFVNVNLICYFRFQIFELYHIFEVFISRFYIISFSCILVTRVELILKNIRAVHDSESLNPVATGSLQCSEADLARELCAY
jgi:hypothetical protein